MCGVSTRLIMPYMDIFQRLVQILEVRSGTVYNPLSPYALQILTNLETTNRELNSMTRLRKRYLAASFRPKASLLNDEL